MVKKKGKDAEYIVGIDLGTTNCTVSYSHLGKVEEKQPIHQLLIPQVVIQGMEKEESSLPSFLYLPLEEEAQSGQMVVSWAKDRKWVAGVIARERGGQLPDRLVSSAKSWLCYDGIDRRSPILPQGSVQGEGKISPVEATTELLRHIKEAWEIKHPEALLQEQKVIVTVPASFDPSARQLVQEALVHAGYPECALLEEPLAAVYAWLERYDEIWREKLKVEDQILVVDIGGGTTDFSLIKVTEQEGNLSLERVAVGDHLLLGGDNMDLCLAYHIKATLESKGKSIDSWQLQGLVHSCRTAKEQLLGDEEKESVDVTIHGRGSKLIGGTLTATLARNEVEELIINGFAPKVTSDEKAIVSLKGGLQQIGLPYAEDPRITCQLASFLQGIEPTHILFNGGTMKASALQKRIVDVLNSWCKTSVTVLDGADLDFAVGRGAVGYGFAREGRSVRIKSGANQSYFIGIEGSRPAIPGILPSFKAMCVVPFGMEEGTEELLLHREFTLLLGSSARFRFFCSHEKYCFGEEVPKIENLEELHFLESTMDAKKGDGTTICVSLKSVVTELGVLELWCIAKDGRSWKLEFDIRQKDAVLTLV